MNAKNKPAATTVANRPPLAAPGGDETGGYTIQALLQSPKTVDKLRQIVPRHLSPERMLRVMAQAVFKTPKLADCHPMTLLGAMMACGSLGLEPNTPLGHCYLIPFEKRKKVGGNWVTERVDVNLIIGYRGYIDLARRSGSLISIHADVVYDGDEFSFEYGSNMHLRHRPIGAREGRRPTWAYAHAKLQDGGEAFEVLPYDQVMAIRNGSEAYKQALRAKEGNRGFVFETSPWVAYEHEMAAKTMVRRLSKWLSMSIEFANAATLDAMSETGRADLSKYADGVADHLTIDATMAETPADDDEDGGDGDAQPQALDHQPGQPMPQPAGGADDDRDLAAIPEHLDRRGQDKPAAMFDNAE